MARGNQDGVIEIRNLDQQNGLSFASETRRHVAHW